MSSQEGPQGEHQGVPANTIHFEHRFRVGWSDLDANAHMGNTSYLDHASNTRMIFFSQHGFSVGRFASEKFGPVVMRDELVYRKELRLMDEFTVSFESAGISYDGVRFRVRNTFYNTANDVAATVTSEGVWFDLERRRPRVPPHDLESLMRALGRSSDYAEIPSKTPPKTD
jgi:acyl-CoA thioester hydrolase